MHTNRLTRRHPFAAARVFTRLIASNATNDVQTQHVASTFHWATVESLSKAHRVTINDLSTAHTAMVSDLNSAHTRAMKELVDQIVTLQNEHRETEVALTENVGKITVLYPLPTIRLRPSLTGRFKNTNETLQAELERAKNNLTLRSAVEIITTTLTECQQTLNRRNRVKDAGVQPVIDAVVRGKFDDLTSTFHDAKATVIRKLTTHGGIKKHDVARALASLYGEISKHHHTGVSDVLTLRHGEQTVAETIASLNLILFARQLYSSKFDALYMDANGNVLVTLSKL
ncbi:hypothetical protein B0H14DRAFT_2799653 [Mycena olivaceomarginata]|nr:hypothetical protein B0H14DRAFT_2799653 [Mycena olivaceomarginata]